MQLKQTAQTLLTDVKHYWKKPPAGRYMPFKENCRIQRWRNWRLFHYNGGPGVISFRW